MGENNGENGHFDVIIAGGGMVGGLLAAGLAVQAPKLSVAVLESQQPAPFEPGTDPEYGLRVSALSIASQRMLEQVGAWSGITARRACPYDAMLVWDGEQHGRTRFAAHEINQPHLGHIVENHVIQLALLERLEALPNVQVFCPHALYRMQHQGQRARACLHDGTVLSARVIVGADGARSVVREQAGIEFERSRYPQEAMVALVDTDLPQQAITWQRFMPTGPQAFLPLCGPRASMVWYNTPDEVARLKALPRAVFMAAMELAFPTELGGLRAVHGMGSFPLVKGHARRYIGPRLALVGDAAHTVHPLAGQGVNLGLLDAGALADVIVRAHARGQDIGSERVLARYQRWRRGNNALMINVLDGFYHAFKPQPLPLRGLRSLALDLANQVGPVKRLVMQQAMGTAGDLPSLARPVV